MIDMLNMIDMLFRLQLVSF